MIRLVLVFIIIIPIIAAFVSSYAVMVVDRDYPANPFKWAQERRRRVERARLVRIKNLEHDLGYVPCSDDKCRSCNSLNARGERGHPIWDHPAIPAPPLPTPIDDLAKRAYDREVAFRTRRGTVSGGPR